MAVGKFTSFLSIINRWSVGLTAVRSAAMLIHIGVIGGALLFATYQALSAIEGSLSVDLYPTLSIIFLAGVGQGLGIVGSAIITRITWDIADSKYITMINSKTKIT